MNRGRGWGFQSQQSIIVAGASSPSSRVLAHIPFCGILRTVIRELPALVRHLIAWLGLCAVLVLAGCASHESYPARPIVLICPWSPGGGTDNVARQVAVQLEQELEVPVNVVNATGGGGVTGHTRGVLARPDGYTLTMATVELNMLHWRGLTDISYRDFEPLVLLNRDAAAVFVRQDAPWQSIEELEQAIRQQPGQLKASGTARGGSWHIALAGWLTVRDIDANAVTWISINGAAPALQELMAQGVDLVCCSVPEARSLLDGGQVRCLGLMSDHRMPLAPGVPTFREQGIDWSLGGWRGIMFPKDVPADRMARMRDALLEVARSDEFARYMDSAGFDLSVGDPAQFQQLLADQDESFRKILTSPAFAQVSQSPIGPMVFPALILVSGLVVLLYLLWRGRLQVASAAAPLQRAALIRLCWVPAAIVFFVITCETIGFILAAGTLLFSLLLARRVHLLTASLVTVLLVPAVYHVFAVILGVPLPWGWMGW